MSNPPSTRPYTSYNLFFQLEREYILQTIHGFRPTIASKDIFDPTHEAYPASCYPLPSRYDNLILPYDWHIPGKTRRRKRSHRKSHGKIGFHELNDQISKAWQDADDNIRNFCARLSDIEAKKYKNVKKKKTGKKLSKKQSARTCVDGSIVSGEVVVGEGKVAMTNSIKGKPNDDCCDDLSPLFEWAGKLSLDEFAAVRPCTASPKISRTVSSNSREREGLSRGSSFRGSCTEVDMDDYEIIDIWKTTATEDNGILRLDATFAASNTCWECDDTNNHKAAISIEDDDDDEEEWKDDTRKSFIDAEYEKFKQIGKQFSSRQPLPSGLTRKAFTACQA